MKISQITVVYDKSYRAIITTYHVHVDVMYTHMHRVEVTKLQYITDGSQYSLHIKCQVSNAPSEASQHTFLWHRITPGPTYGQHLRKISRYA